MKAPIGPLVIPYYVLWWIKILSNKIVKESDAIHACGLESCIPVIILKKIFKIKLIYDIFDYTPNCFPTGKNRFLKVITNYLEKLCIKISDKVIVVDENRLQEIGFKKDVFIIYNSVDKDAYKITMILLNNFTILYSGFISKSRGIDVFIKLAHMNPSVDFIIAGDGPDRNYAINKSISINNIKYLGLLAHEEMINIIASVDIIFAFYDPSIPININASPNKIFEAFMVGTPVIINKEVGIASIIEKNYCGLSFYYTDVDGISETIGTLPNNRVELEKMSQNCYNLYETKFNWKLMKERLIRVYEF